MLSVMTIEQLIEQAAACESRVCKLAHYDSVRVELVEVNRPSTGLAGGSGKYRVDCYVAGKRVKRAWAEAELKRLVGTFASK